MKKQTRFSDQTGFTLIEIMVVVVILGILAAIVVPRFLDKPDEARVTRAAADVEAIEQALAMFKLDNGYYPSTEQGLEALVAKPDTGRIPKKYPERGYLKNVPVDPWENRYVYLSPGVHDDIDIISYGADGEPGGDGSNADIESWKFN